MPRIERTLKLRDDLLTAVKDTFATHVIMRSDSATFQKALDATRAKHPGLPAWARYFVSGYERCMHDDLYRHHLVYGAYIDGVFYCTRRDHPAYYEKHGISAVQFAHDKNKTAGHYWSEPKNGVYMPYFVGE